MEIPLILKMVFLSFSSSKAPELFNFNFAWKVLFLIAYSILNIDLIPELYLGNIGLIDDIIVTLFVIYYICLTFYDNFGKVYSIKIQPFKEETKKIENF